MSCAMSVNPIRDESEGFVSFADWDFPSDYERLAAKCFEEGIENTLKAEPPFMAVDCSSNDVMLSFSIPALGGNGNAPCWMFSLKEAVTDMQCGREDMVDLHKALLAVAGDVKSQIEIAEQGQL